MKARLLLLALVAVPLMSVGCKSKPTLVGEWNGTVAIQGMNVDTNFTFGADGNVAVKQSLNGQGSTQKGTYKESEKSFTMTATSMESTAIPKATLDQINAKLAKANKPINFTLDWKDADTISVTQEGAQPPANVAITLKRKK